MTHVFLSAKYLLIIYICLAYHAIAQCNYVLDLVDNEPLPIDYCFNDTDGSSFKYICDENDAKKTSFSDNYCEEEAATSLLSSTYFETECSAEEDCYYVEVTMRTPINDEGCNIGNSNAYETSKVFATTVCFEFDGGYYEYDCYDDSFYITEYEDSICSIDIDGVSVDYGDKHCFEADNTTTLYDLNETLQFNFDGNCTTEDLVLYNISFETLCPSDRTESFAIGGNEWGTNPSLFAPFALNSIELKDVIKVTNCSACDLTTCSDVAMWTDAVLLFDETSSEFCKNDCSYKECVRNVEMNVSTVQAIIFAIDDSSLLPDNTDVDEVSILTRSMKTLQMEDIFSKFNISNDQSDEEGSFLCATSGYPSVICIDITCQTDDCDYAALHGTYKIGNESDFVNSNPIYTKAGYNGAFGDRFIWLDTNSSDFVWRVGSDTSITSEAYCETNYADDEDFESDDLGFIVEDCIWTDGNISITSESEPYSCGTEYKCLSSLSNEVGNYSGEFVATANNYSMYLRDDTYDGIAAILYWGTLWEMCDDTDIVGNENSYIADILQLENCQVELATKAWILFDPSSNNTVAFCDGDTASKDSPEYCNEWYKLSDDDGDDYYPMDYSFDVDENQCSFNGTYYNYSSHSLCYELTEMTGESQTHSQYIWGEYESNETMMYNNRPYYTNTMLVDDDPTYIIWNDAKDSWVIFSDLDWDYTMTDVIFDDYVAYCHQDVGRPLLCQDWFVDDQNFTKYARMNLSNDLDYSCTGFPNGYELNLNQSYVKELCVEFHDPDWDSSDTDANAPDEFRYGKKYDANGIYVSDFDNNETIDFDNYTISRGQWFLDDNFTVFYDEIRRRWVYEYLSGDFEAWCLSIFDKLEPVKCETFYYFDDDGNLANATSAIVDCDYDGVKPVDYGAYIVGLVALSCCFAAMVTFCVGFVKQKLNERAASRQKNQGYMLTIAKTQRDSTANQQATIQEEDDKVSNEDPVDGNQNDITEQDTTNDNETQTNQNDKND